VSASPSWSRRAAALAALAAPIAAVVILVVKLRGHFGELVATLALLLVTDVAVFFALTRRGAARMAGAAVAVLAGAGLIVVLATNWRGIVLFVLVMALIALFGLAARYALHEDAIALEVVPAPAPGKAALIINLKSGGGKAEHFDLAGEALKRGIEPIILRPGNDLLDLAERAIDGGAEVIGMAGGDGSQALVATVASRRDIPHVCIPAGTRNHFALDLGLDRDDVVGALDAFTDGVERRIDLARVNGRIFVNNASLGAYAKVVQSPEYRDAKLETWFRKLPELLGPDAEPIGLRFDDQHGELIEDATLVLVSNNSYEITHMVGAGTRERIDQGELGVVVARVHGTGVATLAAMQVAGLAARSAGLLTWASPSFVVEADGPVEVGLDGEALKLDAPLRFESLPGALRVRVPRHAGAAPAAAAVRLNAANVGTLLKTAVGR
jgi:diacylglycerol kinase family enzyme